MAKKPIYPLSEAVVNDDRYALNSVIHVDDQVRAMYFEEHKVSLPGDVQFLTRRDGRGRQIMEPYTLKVQFVGAHLQNAIRRAKRWLRNGDRSKRPAGHIGLALMAFAIADPASYQLELSV